MKLTPEQKAFFEYGELFQLWKDARRCVFWHEESHEDIRREIVQKVWQKRAECMAWVHPMRRRCSNCKYEMSQCKWCTVCANEGLPIYWEPRKEGE